jgi:hypothetical protein
MVGTRHRTLSDAQHARRIDAHADRSMTTRCEDAEFPAQSAVRPCRSLHTPRFPPAFPGGPEHSPEP